MKLSLEPNHQQLLPKQQQTLFLWKNCVQLEEKLRKIIRLMRSLFLQKTWRELKKPLRLKQKNNFNRRKNLWKNKKMLRLPKQKLEKPKCSRWTPREHQRLHQPSFKLLKRIRLSHFFQKPKRRWMRT